MTASSLLVAEADGVLQLEVTTAAALAVGVVVVGLVLGAIQRLLGVDPLAAAGRGNDDDGDGEQ